MLGVGHLCQAVVPKACLKIDDGGMEQAQGSCGCLPIVAGRALAKKPGELASRPGSVKSQAERFLGTSKRRALVG